MKYLSFVVIMVAFCACGDTAPREKVIDLNSSNNVNSQQDWGDIGESCESGCDVICVADLYCSDHCDLDSQCPTDYVCGPFRLERRSCEKPVPNPIVGTTCEYNDDCESDVCVSSGGEGYCTITCDDVPCPAGYACQGNGRDSSLCILDTPDNSSMPTEFAYRTPPNEITISIDSGDITFGWEGGNPPYELQLGSTTSPTRIAQTDETSYDVTTEAYPFEVDRTYYWRVISGVGTAQEVEGPLYQFTTKSNRLPACPNTPTVSVDGKAYRTVQVGQTCWMAENLTRGDIITGPASDNGIVERYCDTDMCERDGFYTLWETYQEYTASVPSLEGSICPSGWQLPTSAQYQQLVDEVGLTNLALNSDIKFPLNGRGNARDDQFETCNVNGTLVSCTPAPSFNQTGAWLWMAEPRSETEQGYFRFYFFNGEWRTNTGMLRGNFALSVRCVR